MFSHWLDQIRNTLARPAQRRPVRGRTAVRPRVEALEDRQLLAANLTATEVFLVDRNGQKIDKAAVGQLVSIGATFKTQDLPSLSQYVVRFSLVGSSKTTGLLNWGAGAAGGSYFAYWNDWVVKAGMHTIKVEVDAGNTVAETTGLDNVKTATFTPVTFQSSYGQSKLITPLAGTPWGHWTIVNYNDLDSRSGDSNTLDYM